MIVKNPTDKDVSIVIGGVTYTVEAGGETSVSEAVATKWVGTHAFLSLSQETGKPEEETENVVPKEEEVAVSEEDVVAPKRTRKTK